MYLLVSLVASHEDCPNPECAGHTLRVSVGPFDDLDAADGYRLAMAEPGRWALTRLLAPDPDRDMAAPSGAARRRRDPAD